MAGRRRLRDVEAGVNVADADFAVLEHRQNPQAGWIRQRTVNRGERFQIPQTRRRSRGAARF